MDFEDIVNRRKKEYEETYQNSSKNRLSKILKKKTTTSFIGALAKFELHFGQVWGHGKLDSECTPNQLVWRKIWENTRTEVLNNGNTQLRAIDNEISQYDISWNRYETNLPLKDSKEDL